ncbi:hypothetical protein [Pseudarthrobacter albicanus]|uniref:hypothetical protein n=1 Tax=Pseudarthrobacter albicanus TaxID=2823873 RepID=UPI001BA836CB|nr:hypothetical protein [Pseudarthrobacter albicanus]
MSEPEIAEVIDTVRAHEAAAGTPPEAEFGTAEEYAKQFPKKKRRIWGTIITTIGTALSIAYVLLAVLLMLLFRVDIRDVASFPACRGQRFRHRVARRRPRLSTVLEESVGGQGIPLRMGRVAAPTVVGVVLGFPVDRPQL